MKLWRGLKGNKMQKITISRDELICHKKYFYENVVDNLNQMKEKYKKGATTSRKQWKFLSLCLYYKKQLAIGKPYQLRKIQKIIGKNYADIFEKDEKFKEEVEKAFGYDNFSSADIGCNLLEYAKKKSKVCRNGRYDDKKILKELYTELEKCNVELADEIQTKIKNLNGDINKKVLVNIIGETLVVHIVDKDILIDKLAEWNPYIMQFHRKIRTCPYCNRQYITPMYSRTGRARADLDHFYPKSKYPYFSMSIYNLIPSCKSCNSSLKGMKEFSFEDRTPYEISIDDSAEFKFFPHSKIQFCKKEEDKDIDKYKEIFNIEELYEFHRSYAKDLLRKRLKYPTKRIKELAKMGFFSEQELYKFIIGKISTKEKILEEPLNKFKRDLVREIFGEEILKMVEE
jgi:hypothetical protein